MVEHRAERVVGVVGLAPRSRPPRRSRSRGCPTSARPAARPASVSSEGLRWTVAAPGLDHRPAVGLLVVGDPDHEHLALEVEQLAGERQRRAPLAGAGLGRELRDARLACCRRPARRRCSACASRRARRPRTCNRCARGCRAPARAAAREAAASAATACRPRAPRRGSRSRARPRPPARSAHREQRRQVLGSERLLGAGVKRRQAARRAGRRAG